MRSSGPIPPGSIQEAILVVYWMQQRIAEVHLGLAQILAPNDRQKSADSIKLYIERYAPYLAQGTPTQTIDEMRASLDEWAKQPAIGIPIGPTDQPMMYSSSRAVRKFSRLKHEDSKEISVGRRRPPLSSRDRPKTGGK